MLPIILFSLIKSALSINCSLVVPAAGCTQVDLNNTRYWSSKTCTCLTCDTTLNLILALDFYTCCDPAIAKDCQTCGSNFSCTACIANYGFNDTSCARCDTYYPNCIKCLTIDTCVGCLSQYSVNDSHCVPCYLYMPYCSACYSSKSMCFQCNTTIYAVNTGTDPHQCDYCNRTLSYCSTCNSPSFCTSCYSNLYGINYTNYWPPSQYCYPCNKSMAGCYNCSGLSYCHSCINISYVLNKATHRCDPCTLTIPYCQICNSSIYCLRCTNPKYTLVHLLNISIVNICQECAALMMDCLYCSSSTYCSKCTRGRKTNMGCTTIVGCSMVNSTISTDINCIGCDPLSFFVNPVNGTQCVCITGWVVGQHCTTIVGCTGLTIINNTKVCMSCNYTSHFVLSNGTCACQKYYYLTANQTCQQICGDGHLIYLQCDDGNLINGDGCSSQCQVEPSFVCINDKSLNPESFCKYKGKVKLTLNGIYKVANKNQVKIIFDIKPYNGVMLKMNLTKSVSFNSTGSDLTSSSIISQQLILTIEYDQNIQGKSAKIIVLFDPAYVISPNCYLNFQLVESTGQALSYNSSTSTGHVIIFENIMTILSFLSLIIFALGSLSYKMIGVQTIQTIQIIIILQASSNYFESLFINFQKLQISLGRISLFLASDDSGLSLTQRFYSNLGYTQDMKQNYFLFIFINGIAILAYLIIKTVSKFKEFEYQQFAKQVNKNNKEQMKRVQKNQIKYRKIKSYQQKIYAWSVFPIIIGFYYHFLNVVMIHIFASNDSQSFKVLSIYTFFIIFSLVYCSEIKVFLIKQVPTLNEVTLKAGKEKYVGYYLVYSFMVYIMVQMTTFKLSSSIYFAIICLITLYIFFLIVYLPYQNPVHNISLIINQLSTLFTAVWITIKRQAFYNSNIEAIFIYIFIGSIVLILIFAIMRIILSIRQFYLAYKQAKNNLDNKDKIIGVQQFKVNITELMESDLHSMTRYNQVIFRQKSSIVRPFKDYKGRTHCKHMQYLDKETVTKQQKKKMLLMKYQNQDMN